MANSARSVPKDYHSLNAFMVVNDARKAIDFYKRAFGAEEVYRMETPDGKRIAHAELKIGDTVLMLSDEMPNQQCKSAMKLGGTPVGFYCYVDDVDQVFQKAIDAGGKEGSPVVDMFWGDRCGNLIDPFGNVWTIATHCEELSPEEIDRRAKEFYSKKAA